MECQGFSCQGTGTCSHFRKSFSDKTRSCGLELVFSHAWLSLRSCCARRALQPSKNPFLDTLKAVVIDIRFFLFLLLLTVWGFACAFYILFRRDQSKHVRPLLPVSCPAPAFAAPELCVLYATLLLCSITPEWSGRRAYSLNYGREACQTP